MFSFVRNIVYLCFALAALGLLVAFLYMLKLKDDYQLDNNALGGALWELPARVYAQPLDLFVGEELDPNFLVKELQLIQYREDAALNHPETYYRQDNQVFFYTKNFTYWDRVEPSRRLQVSFNKAKVIESIRNTDTNENLVMARVEPLHIASIYPAHQQDRILVNLNETPDILIDALIAVEDRRFWYHPGIDPKGLARSIYVTFIKRSGYQGASTLTQQFIKNHFLSREQTISRKIKEMLMALVVEYYYSKEQILEAYLNEIYLGQDGSRAIHGFGLASEFYFDMPLKDLRLHQIATLITLVREPGQSDPRKYPKNALRRRNLILRVMADRGVISPEQAEEASQRPLELASLEQTYDRQRFPAFVDLVNEQLAQVYKKEDLTRDGLQIFTTLSPQMQMQAQNALSEALPVLEKNNKLQDNFLQAASVIVDTASGEVRAVIGSRVAGEQGYNRAITAKRQPGSAIKPPVYLAALEYPGRYTLATLLDDSPLEYRAPNGDVWRPRNYSRSSGDFVLLHDALTRSLNIPTARIALDLGMDDIIGTLERLGARPGLPHYPSVVLGTVNMSVLEMAQIYETFANGGYYTPLRAIREITDSRGQVVDRFPLSGVKAIEETPYYLIVSTLQDVVRQGTARRLNEKIPAKLNIAGKTGTSNDYRDSWFVGFSGDLLNVVWMGNDRNLPIAKVTGSSGAMRVWMDIMKDIPMEPLLLKPPRGIVFRSIDPENGLLSSDYCPQQKTVRLPFISGSEPLVFSECYEAPPAIIDDNGWEVLPLDAPQQDPDQESFFGEPSYYPFNQSNW